MNKTLALSLASALLEELTSRLYSGMDMSYKSITDYGRRLRGLTRGLWNGEIDRFRFVDDVLSAMTRAFNQAWTEGARTQGVEPSERTPEEEAKLQEMINTQSGYIPGLADWIIEHAKLPVPEAVPEPPEEITPEPQVFSDIADPIVFDPFENDAAMMNEWGSEKLPTISGMDKNSQKVLMDYQGERYKEINNSLRNIATEEIGEEIIEQIEIMDRALNPLRQELTVFRGAINVPPEMLTQGTEFIDNAFSSTSLDQYVGAGFADKKIPGTKTIFQIDLPPEVRGVFMGEGATGAALTEVEVLLERGLRFRVGDVVGQFDGDYGPINIIRLEVVGRG